MARGKHLSVEEARKQKGGFKQFAQEHPAVGDKEAFDDALEAMAEGKPARRLDRSKTHDIGHRLAE